MKIYFAASIRGGRERAKVYPAIVEVLEDMGHVVLTGMFANQDLNDNEGTDPDKSSEFIYQRDIKWLDEADAVVAEVTQPSLGVGYEIAWAENAGKKIICLFWSQPNIKLSAMIEGSPKINVIYYKNIKEVKIKLKDAL